MNVTVVLIIGGVIGALDGVGIFFAREEAFKIEIFVAAILKGILVALLTGLSLTSSSAWWQGALCGLLYGFAFALVIFLAKGGFKSMDAPYVVPSGAILGIVMGLLLVKLAFPKL
jgi:tetrahydromethanopterin S-methyltransferase subunit E